MKKRNKKLIVGIMAMSFMVQTISPSASVQAKERGLKDAVKNAWNNNLTMEEAKSDLTKQDKRDDDRDGLANYWEESIKTDKNKPDTDGDGLTDYEEVVLTGTDPLKVDTYGDGISDANSDADGDGLTNKEEIKLGTNPLAADTDEDGLSDWDEVKKYKTDPTIYDTDADGASDGFEVGKMTEGKKGFNPLVKNKKMKSLLLDETTEESSEAIATFSLKARANNGSIDSDGDGIPDYKDTAPFERGLKGGIVGSLQIVGSHKPDAAFSDGHAFLVYTSYVNSQSVVINNIYGSYSFNNSQYGAAVAKNEQLLSWRSVVNECKPENDALRKSVADSMWPMNGKYNNYFNLNTGNYVAIGNFTQKSYMGALSDAFVNAEKGTMAEMLALQALYEQATGQKVDVMYIMTHLEQVTETLANKGIISNKDVINGKTDGGIWVNREMYDQRYQYDQYPHEIYRVDITQAEYNKMMESINNNNYYSVLNHNCSSVATLAWNAAVGFKTDANGNYVTDTNGNRIKSDLNLSARGKGVLSILDFPGAVCEEIVKLKQKGTTRGSYYSDYSHIVRGEDFLK